jgi:hypothetical protein
VGESGTLNKEVVLMPDMDTLRIQMREVEPVLKALDAELERINFDPQRPASVAKAQAQTRITIERRLADFRANPILGPLIEELKAHYAEGIGARVADMAPEHPQAKPEAALP